MRVEKSNTSLVLYYRKLFSNARKFIKTNRESWQLNPWVCREEIFQLHKTNQKSDANIKANLSEM